MNPRLHNVRFTLAWIFNILVYLMSCWIALTFGTVLGNVEFDIICLAWLAGLAVTWAVVEPAEIVGVALLPRLFEGGPLGKLRGWCKDLGFY